MSILRWPLPISNNEPLLKKMLLALILLNIGDMAFTLWGVRTGIFVEVNPLMRWCLNQGMAFFVLVKTGLCFQFVLGSILMAKKVRYFALLTSFIVIIYSAVVIRTVGLLI